MKYYLTELKNALTKIEIREIGILILGAFFVNHLTQSEYFIKCGPPYGFLIRKEFPTKIAFLQFEKIMDATLLSHGFSKAQHLKVTEETNYQYRTATDFGYLRFDEMTEAVAFGRLKKALNKTLNAFQNKTGIIIDLRFNGGGWDKMAYKIANRFVAKNK